MQRLYVGLTGAFLVASVMGLGSSGCSAADDGGGDDSSGGTFSSAGGSSGSGGSGNGGSGASSSGGSGGTSFAGTSFGGTLSSGGNAGSGGNSGSGGSGGDSCAGDVSKAERIPLDMIVMLDRSLSMNELAGAQTKWAAVTSALDSFFGDTESAGIGVGLQYFPANAPCTGDGDCTDGFCYLNVCNNTVSSKLQPCQSDADCPGTATGTCVPLGGCGSASCVEVGSDCGNGLGTCSAVTASVCVKSGQTPDEQLCEAPQYATPSVGIAELPGNGAALTSSLAAHDPAPLPFGFTPTGPALQGAIDYAKEWAVANPTHRVVAVLATDGFPTKCAPSGDSAVAAIAAVGRFEAEIETFTVGVFKDGDVEGPQNVQAIAESGGGQAFIVDQAGDVAQQFIDALNAIRGEALECEFEIPDPPQGETLDYEKVNVEFSDGSTTTTIPFVGSPAACDPVEGGWYYDVPPSVDTPSKILVCDQNCDVFKSTPGAEINIRVGCETVVIIPK